MNTHKPTYCCLLSVKTLALVLLVPVRTRADCTPAPDSSVAWWKAQGDAQDSAGPHHAVPSGATFAAGQVGQAFSFDGGNDGVSAVDAAALRPTTNLTIEGWIKTPGVSPSAQASFIVARSGSGTSGYELGVYPLPTGELRFTLNGGGGGADLFSTNGVTDNSFHHVAATYDGQKMRIYRDGVCEAEKLITNAISYSPGDSLWIGRREASAIPGHFLGLIDELSIYNRVLSASEISAIYAAGSDGKCNSPKLNIAALPGAVRLTWSTNATGYLLETNSALTLPASWGLLTSNLTASSTRTSP